MKEIFKKNCPNCGDIQSYNTKYRLKCSIMENWVCNKCSSVHKKKTYDDDIINDIVEYKSGEEISKIMNLGKPFIEKFIDKSGFRRNKSEGSSVGLVKRFRKSNYDDYINSLSDFKKYKKKVISITNKQPISELSNFNKRGVSGIEGNFHLDHKFSIVEGFIQNISPSIIGNIKNLEFIPWEENVKKRTNCSINITELIN
jgi:hypothetical protein